jgi:hypothetical protein
MARKPREQWTEAYRRRVERAEKAGLSRQAARGHKEPQEYKRRAAREIKRRGITSDQLRSVRRYADRRAAKNKALNPNDLVAFAKENGWRAFKSFREERAGMARGYREARKTKTYKPQPLDAFKARFTGGGSGFAGGVGAGGDYSRDYSGDDFDGYSGEDYASLDEDENEDFFADEWDGEYDDLDIEWMYYHDD